MEKLNKTPQWDHAKDELLIELVKLKPELYDLTSPYYSDIVAKRRSWMEISTQMDCEGSKCKERWESLRAQYRKHMNKVTNKSGQAATNNIKWKYEAQMSFLRALSKDRTRITSLQQDKAETIDDTEDNSTQQLCSPQVDEEKDEIRDIHVTLSQQVPPTRKRKIQPNYTSASATLMKYLVEKRKEEQPTDPIDTFFSLMATTVKKFNPADQHNIKTEVFSLVSGVEAKYIHNENVQTHAPPTHHTCPLPSVSPALSHYSSASSTSSQHTQQLHHTPYQEPIHEAPSPPCSSLQWPDQQDNYDLHSL